MKKLKFIKNKPLLWSLTSGVVATSIVAIVVPTVLLNKKSSSVQSQIELQRSEVLESQMNIFVEKSNETINIVSLRKSIKMSLELYRGGAFDISEAFIKMPNQADLKNISFSALADYIDNASLNELKLINSNFTKIKFIKPFWLPFNNIYEVNQAISKKETVQSITRKIINYGIEGIYGAKIDGSLIGELNQPYSDYNFFANGSMNNAQVISFNKFLSRNEFMKYVKYQDQAGKWYNPEEMKANIASLVSMPELTKFLNGAQKYQRPYIVTNLQDDFLIKFKDVSEAPLITEHEMNDSPRARAIEVEISHEWDPIFGINNSWSQYEFFCVYFYANNVVSPLFLYKKHEIEKWNHFGQDGIWPWDTSINQIKWNLYQKNVIDQSTPYSLPLDYLDVINYKNTRDKAPRSLIPLNKTKYFEQALHDTQTDEHGVMYFPGIKMFNGETTEKWYPHHLNSFFSSWQYTNKFVQWGYKTTFPSQSEVDVAHKNGAEIYATYFTDNPPATILNLLTDTEENKMLWVEGMIAILKDRGIDGLFWNAELSIWGGFDGKISFTPGAYQSLVKFLKYIKTSFEANGLKFMGYSPNNDGGLIRTAEQEQWLTDRGGKQDPHLKDSWMWETKPSEIVPRSELFRGYLMSPGNSQTLRYHFDENYNVTDDGLGYADLKDGSKADVFMSVVDRNADFATTQHRIDFSKSAYGSHYNQIVMGNEGFDGIYVAKEMEYMQSHGLGNKYYADFAMYATPWGLGNAFQDWEQAAFIATGSRILPSRYPQWTGYDQMDNMYDTSVHTLDHRARITGSFSQDPRSTTKTVSNYFQERSTLDNDEFTTAFDLGYGHEFNLNGASSQFGDWQNVGMQDIMPTYRFLVDVHDAQGNLVSDQASNYKDRKIKAFTDHVSDAWFGPNALHYTGTLASNESFINKLYVTNIANNKTFNLYVKDNKNLNVELELWRNKNVDNLDLGKNSETVKPNNTEDLPNGYKKLTFNVTATDLSKITSFGIKVTNKTGGNVDVKDLRIGGISYSNANPSKNHDITNITATTNNDKGNGINVVFKDSDFNAYTRYAVYDADDKLIYFTSRPELHLLKGGNYKVRILNAIGETQKQFDLLINNIVSIK